MHFTLSWVLSLCLFTSLTASEEIPKWAEGSPEKLKEYYALHEESSIDRILGSVASRLGIIIHGDFSQEELAQHLNQFDIQKLFAEGPYTNALLSFEAQQLILEGLHSMPKVFDIHLHNFGYDEGNYLNPKIAARGVASWKDYLIFLALRYAAGISSTAGSTQEARQRMQLYAQHFPRLIGMILPIHKAHDLVGTKDWDNTGSFLKNRSALKTALTFDQPESELLPAISVHPFDPKWHQKLLQAHAKGIRLVKWMPPQSIPPDSDFLDDFYIAMRDLGMTLIAHSGPEHTIPTNEGNLDWADWGNPLRFRKPLQMGVNVVLAHCGRKDMIPDLDLKNPQAVPGYQLFIRLAQEAHQKNLSGEWSGKLYGDLAAVTTHYGPDFTKQLLLHVKEEGFRLIYGSDYPFTNLVKPKEDAYDLFSKADLLDAKKVQPLKEIRNWNPLLANYLFTRNLAMTMKNGEKVGFPECTFTADFLDGALNLFDADMWAQYKSHLTN